MKPSSKTIDNPEALFRPWDMLYFVIWFGVLSGLAEVILPQMNELRGGKIVYLRCHTIWMSPLANVAVLGIVGLVTLPLLLRLSRSMAVRIAFILLASMVFLNVLVLEFGRFEQIHFASKVILAVGLSVALQRLIARRTTGFERFVRHTMIGLALMVLVLTVAVGSKQHIRERRIIASLPDAPPSAPNVLLIVLDTVRAESMSLYGYKKPTTPYLRELGKESTIFQQAIATSSWTLPSHVSLFTGRFRYETSANYIKPLDTAYPTLAEMLTSQGYITGGFVANNLFCRVEHGIARGFSHYEDYVASLREFGRSSSLVRFAFLRQCSWFRRLIGYYGRLDHKPAPRITNDFLRWIDHIPSGHPFFAFLNYFDAHQPYLPPAEFARRFGCTELVDMYRTRYGPDSFVTRIPSKMSIKEIESLRNTYDACIAYIDHNLEQLFSELKQRSLLDSTLVILVSDHGEEFGEHNTLRHGFDLQIQSIRVPLLLRLPGIVPNKVSVQEPVTIRDIPATVVDLLDFPDIGLFPGESLRRYWTKPGGEDPTNCELVLSELSHAPWAVNWAPISKGNMKSLVIRDMHYIRNGDGSEEVYDLSHDPKEFDNLIQTLRGVEAAAQARFVLEGILH